VKGILCASLLASLHLSAAAQAYEADIHYSTTYVLARAVGFTGADALTIASANQGVDENHDTVAALELDSISNSLHQAEKNLRFHCFSETRGHAGRIAADVHKVIADHFAGVHEGVADPRRNSRRLIALGAALHCQQDAHAHVGFGGSCGSHTGSCLGHTYESFLDQLVFGLLKKHYFNPDHPGVSGAQLLETLQGTATELAAHRPKATSIPNNALAALSDAMRKSGLELPDEVRRECNRYIAGKWLFDFFRSGSTRQSNPDTLEKLRPEVAGSCKNASLGSATIVRIPAPRFPRLNADASPHLVRADGTYLLLGHADFDSNQPAIPKYGTRKASMQLSHWRQLLAASLVAQTAF
jgi:uncharacterized protein DUF6765